MSSVLRTQRSMSSVADHELKSGFALRLIDYQILKELQRAEGVQLLGEVARRLLVHATTVSIAIDRLAVRSLATRRGHPTDRRATLVEITDGGREVADGATAALDRVEFGLTADDIQGLAEALGRLGGDPVTRC